MIYIIAAILIFGVLIAVHELGHFLAAKACGVRVNEFSIGMGPALLKKTKGDTQYSLRLLPIGGFCAMEGEEEDSDDPAALNNQGFWQKLLIFAAGALMNFLPSGGRPHPVHRWGAHLHLQRRVPAAGPQQNRGF